MLFKHFLTITWRELRKYKVRSLIRILSMAIGFTAFMLGGYWWYWENHFDSFQPQNDRLFAIITYGMIKNPDGGEAGLNQLHKEDAVYFKNHIPEIDKICFMGRTRYELENKNQIDSYLGLMVDSMFFQLFYHRFLDGGYQGLLPDGKSVILTRKMAMKLYGTVHCSGEIIHFGTNRLGQEEIYKVTGVMEDYPVNSELKFDLLQYGTDFYNPRMRAVTYVSLHPKADVEKVKQKIAAHKSVSVDPLGIDVSDLWRFELTSLADVHLTCYPQLGNRFRNIRILAFAGLLVLISALMNHLVLFVGHQQKKDREFITRVSLGSTGGKLVMKMYVELLLPLCLAFIVALCLIELLFPVYCEYTSIQGEYGINYFVSQMNRTELLGKVLVGMGLCVILFTAVSSVPVWFIFREKRKKISDRQYAVWAPLLFRRSLISGQIFIGSLFLIASLGMYKQLSYLKHKDLGIDLNQVMQISLGFRTAARIDAEHLKQELKASPLIQEVTMTVEPVLSSHGIDYGNRGGYIPVEGRDFDKFKARNEDDYLFCVEENFFDFFRLHFKAGKGISAENPKDYVINETGVKELGFPDILQRPLEGIGDRKIAGIIRDYQYTPLQYRIQKVFFLVERDEYHLGLGTFYYAYVRYVPGYEEQVREYIATVMSSYSRGEVPEEKMIIRLNDIIDEFNRPEVVIFTLFSVLAVLCILVSSFGIFSLVALSTEQRRKEIAIRKVNGAMFQSMFFLFLKEYLWLVGIGGGVALLAGYRLMQNWLETYANHICLGGALFILVAVLIISMVCLAVAIQVKKAASTNPSEALKEGE